MEGFSAEIDTVKTSLQIVTEFFFSFKDDRRHSLLVKIYHWSIINQKKKIVNRVK